MERQDAISELYAMYYAYGNTMMYYTFNPRLLDDPLSVRQRHYLVWEWRRSQTRGHPSWGYDWGRHRGFPDYKTRAALLQSCDKAIPSNRR